MTTERSTHTPGALEAAMALVLQDYPVKEGESKFQKDWREALAKDWATIIDREMGDKVGCMGQRELGQWLRGNLHKSIGKEGIIFFAELTDSLLAFINESRQSELQTENKALRDLIRAFKNWYEHDNPKDALDMIVEDHRAALARADKGK